MNVRIRSKNRSYPIYKGCDIYMIEPTTAGHNRLRIFKESYSINMLLLYIIQYEGHDCVKVKLTCQQDGVLIGGIRTTYGKYITYEKETLIPLPEFKNPKTLMYWIDRVVIHP